MNLSCGAADQVGLGEAEGPKTRRVPGGEKVGPASRVQALLGCWKGKKEGKERAIEDAMFLYPAKAAAGLCTRFA
jgi:hypothetical protein